MKKKFKKGSPEWFGQQGGLKGGKKTAKIIAAGVKALAKEPKCFECNDTIETCNELSSDNDNEPCLGYVTRKAEEEGESLGDLFDRDN